MKKSGTPPHNFSQKPGRTWRLALPFLLAAFACLATANLCGEAPTQRVGLPLLLEDIYLTGPELEPVPRSDRDTPLIIRLVETKPAQDGFRYTFEVQGLDPGNYNLANYLREVAAESGTSPHAIPLTITTALPPGLPQPAELAPKPTPRIGGYRALIWVLVLVWLAGLAWLFFSGKGKARLKKTPLPEPTVADHMKPLLQKASQGQLTTDEQAQLERFILAHWRQQVPEVSSLSTAESLTHLRSHQEASPLLLKLEHWIHAPQSDLSATELESLLQPYQN